MNRRQFLKFGIGLGAASGMLAACGSAAKPTAAPAAGEAKPTEAKAPRRAQTLELSAAMIELLVKLDGQSESGDAAAAAQPPKLPEPAQVPAPKVALPQAVQVASAPAAKLVSVTADKIGRAHV